MPFPLLPLAGVAAGAIATGIQNRRSQNFSREMYQRQYQDNVKFWQMQNAYNDPSAQMQRLKAAGLNPAMIYGGQGAGAAGQAGDVGKQSVTPAQFATPDFSGFASSSAQAIQSKTADAMIHKANQEAIYTASKTVGQNISNRYQSDLAATSIDLAKAQAAKTRVEASYIGVQERFTLDENQRKAAMNASNLREATERILTMQAQRTKIPEERELLRAQAAKVWADKALTQTELDMREQGFSWNDRTWMRMMGLAMQYLSEKKATGIGDALNQALENLQNSMSSFWEKGSLDYQKKYGNRWMKPKKPASIR